jgi:DNA-binding NtrC family response regulator
MNTAVALTGFTTVLDQMREGRFKQALTDLRPLGTPRRIGERAMYELLRAELLFELGDLNGCITICHALTAEDDPTLVTRRERTLTRAHFYSGNYRGAMDCLQHARQASIESGIPLLRAQVELVDLALSSGSRRFESTSSALTDLKRLVAHIGDPHLMVELRLCVARAEARSNSLAEASKHLSTARALLERYPNLWLAGSIELDSSIIAALSGDIDESLAYLNAAASYAEQSGHFRTKVSAMINSAQLLADLGHCAKARSLFESSIREAQQHPQLLLAALDGKANLLLTEGDNDEALATFDRIGHLSQALGDARLHWDKINEDYSRARLALSRRMWQEASTGLAKAATAARASHDKMWTRRIELLLVKSLAAQNQAKEAATHLHVDLGPPLSIELVARWYDALAALFHANSNKSNVFLARSLRIAASVRNRALAHDLRVRQSDDPIENSAALPESNLDAAVALIDVAGHPQVLAREAFALVQGADCVHQGALISRGAKSIRVLESHGWDERDALHFARKTDGIEAIECGTSRGEALQIIARPEDDIERRCTWIAIRKLVDTALTLDRYRREEKQRAALWPAESLEGDPDILWVSESVNEVVRVAKRIAAAPLTVLLTGETGTGKEMLAKTIHLSSPRAERLMLPFNCTAVPRDMLESQLFGYRKGAFTGADTSFTGVIRAAEGGTLFLDEIADMPIDLQPKLLRFLETHEIHPLGEPRPMKVDVRVIAATNANLEQLVAEGRFRQDLFYRLTGVRLHLPPLRERREEIPALVDHYIRRYGEQQKKGRLTLTDEALEYLLLYAWPGNLRQLANEVNRMVAMAEPDSALNATHLSAEIQATRRTVAATAAPDSEHRISLDQSLPDAVEELERTMIQAALDRTNGRLEDAAKVLGISRKGLFLKRRRWGFQGN